jgi:small-conductance mechanosensitive channel
MSAPLSIKRYFLTIRRIHSYLLAGLALFTLVVSITLKENNVEATGRNMTFLIIAGIASVSMVFGSAFVYRALVKTKLSAPDIKAKLDGYRQACIVQYAMLEFPVLLSVTFYLITADLLFAAFILTGIVIFMLNRPSKEQFINDFQLSEQEKKHLDSLD